MGPFDAHLSGQCSWYRSMKSQPRRMRLWSRASVMAEAFNAFGPPLSQGMLPGPETFVAITKSSLHGLKVEAK